MGQPRKVVILKREKCISVCWREHSLEGKSRYVGTVVEDTDEIWACEHSHGTQEAALHCAKKAYHEITRKKSESAS